MQDLRQTKEYAGYMQNLGWQVLPLNLESRIENWVYLKSIPILGRVAKLQRPGSLQKKDVKKIIEENNIKVFFLESSIHNSIFNIQEFSLAKSSFLPSKTIHINLTNSEHQLLKDMHHKTRYNIKIAQKRGIMVKESQDIELFATLWTQSAKKRGMWLGQKKEINALWRAFGAKANLLLAYSDNLSVAGLLVVRSKDTAYYLYAGSSQEGKKLFAPTLVAWEAIKLAKKVGCKIFDFEGIYDERYHSQTRAWKGFTRFKQSFGGQIITYPQTLVYYKNLIYKLFI